MSRQSDPTVMLGAILLWVAFVLGYLFGAATMFFVLK